MPQTVEQHDQDTKRTPKDRNDPPARGQQDLPASKYPRSYTKRMYEALDRESTSRGDIFPSNPRVSPQISEARKQSKSTKRRSTR